MKTLGASCVLGSCLLIGGASGGEPLTATYARDVAPILQRRCQSCHRPGEAAPMSLLDYSEVRPWAQAIEEEVVSRRMPPWHAGPQSLQFSNDPSLAREEIDAIARWVEAGAPEGDARDLPPPRRWTPGWNIGSPDVVLTMVEDFPVPANGTVEYQYFQVPTGFQEDRWVRAVEVRPGNRAVVHHILVFVLAPEREAGEIVGRDLIRARGAWDIYLGGMVPGGGPIQYPEGTGKRIPARSTLLFQVHYTPNGKAVTDRSSIGLLFARTAVRTEVVTRAIANQSFLISPGSAAHPVAAEYTFSRDARLLSLMPHMHLRGKSFEYRAAFPDGTERLLLSVPRYDFAWQHTYQLVEPLAVPGGTRILCRATFDNSAGNRNNPDPTRAVRWGDQTWEEMMIGFIDFSRSLREGAKAVRRGEF